MNQQQHAIAGYVECKSLPIDVDHILICSPQETSAAQLQQLGLYSPYRPLDRGEHGTAARLVFFENFYLEFIWITDLFLAVRSAINTGVDLFARAHWPQTRASPFGIGLCSQLSRRKPHSGETPALNYHSPSATLVAEASVCFSADNLARQAEPLCFLVPHHITLTALLNLSCQTHQHLISHPLGIRRLTGIKIISQNSWFTPQVCSILSQAGIDMETNTAPLAVLTFDGGQHDQILDARPILPLVLKY